MVFKLEEATIEYGKELGLKDKKIRIIKIFYEEWRKKCTFKEISETIGITPRHLRRLRKSLIKNFYNWSKEKDYDIF